MSEENRDWRRLVAEQTKEQRHVSVGLDPDFKFIKGLVSQGLRLPGLRSYYDRADLVVAFNTGFIEATRGTAVYKPNLGFYLSLGRRGSWALKKTIERAREISPTSINLIDAKSNEIGNTSERYVEFLYGYCKADAITVNPYLGNSEEFFHADSMTPFLKNQDKGIYVLVVTSNPGSMQFQNLILTTGERLYERVAYVVTTKDGGWNRFGNIGIVLGATYPHESRRIRELVGDEVAALFPGVGVQGQSAKVIVELGLRKGQYGHINSSRGLQRLTVENPNEYFLAVNKAYKKLDEEIKNAQDLLIT